MSQDSALLRFIDEAERSALLALVREARDLGLYRPLYQLNHYNNAQLRRVLRRLGPALMKLPSIQRHLRANREMPPPVGIAQEPHPKAIRWYELRQKLFPGVWGMEAEKDFLIERLYLPLAYPGLAKRYGLHTSPMIVVEGPPGSGKTTLFRALAKGTQWPVRLVATPSLASMWYGDTERRLRQLFQKASRKAPAILVFDEIESLFPARDKNLPWLTGTTSQFLISLDELRSQNSLVAVVGLTNQRQALDQAILRSERIDGWLYISLPDVHERELILRQAAQNFPCTPGIPWHHWAEKTEGFSRADLISWLREAAQFAFTRDRETGTPQLITESDLQRAFHR